MAVTKRPTDKGTRIRQSLAQSNYITAAWTWFMILAGKAAEPVLVASVLYASVKLLPIVHFPPPLDVVVFIAQFVALDIGGLSLNKLADQAKKDGNEEGAKQAKRLSLALVAVMLIGVIMAGVDQIIKLDGQVGTVIDTVLLIARAVMAVLYSRVIHRLRNDEINPYQIYEKEEIDGVIADTVKQVIRAALMDMRQEIVSHLEARLSHTLDERFTELDRKQVEAMARFKEEQTCAMSDTSKTIMATLETAVRRQVDDRQQPTETQVPSSKVRSITEAASRKRQTSGRGERAIDKIIWPLLDTGLTVRAIATRANTSTATVGRSRKRWEASNELVPSQPFNGETTSDTATVKIQQATV